MNLNQEVLTFFFEKGGKQKGDIETQPVEEIDQYKLKVQGKGYFYFLGKRERRCGTLPSRKRKKKSRMTVSAKNLKRVKRPTGLYSCPHTGAVRKGRKQFGKDTGVLTREAHTG